jgi:hypothetical protein
MEKLQPTTSQLLDTPRTKRKLMGDAARQIGSIMHGLPSDEVQDELALIREALHPTPKEKPVPPIEEMPF